MIRISLILIVFSTLSLSAQNTDFLILKKGNKFIKNYFGGSNIEFVTTSGAYRNGVINRILNDSIYIQEFLIRRLQTNLGFYIIDTAGSFRYVYHYNQIKSIGNDKNNFNWKGSGAALLGGGTLLTIGSGVVYLADREKFSPILMAASGGLATVGYFMSKAGSKSIVLGKKNYRLQYMNLSPK